MLTVLMYDSVLLAGRGVDSLKCMTVSFWRVVVSTVLMYDSVLLAGRGIDSLNV